MKSKKSKRAAVNEISLMNQESSIFEFASHYEFNNFNVRLKFKNGH